MRIHFLLFAILWTFLGGPVPAQEPNQHRRPDDIQQYLEQLDRTERDEYKSPFKRSMRST